MIFREEDTPKGEASLCTATYYLTVHPQYLLKEAGRSCVGTGIGCFCFCAGHGDCSDTGPKPKRRPGGGFDDRASDDSDFDDLRQIGGFRRGMQSASAKSVCRHTSLAAHCMMHWWLVGLQEAGDMHKHACFMHLRHESTLANCRWPWQTQ